MYKEAYDLFAGGNYTAANKTVASAHALGLTPFTPTLSLLEIMIAGRTEDIARYQYLLGEYISANTGTDLGTYAQKLLDASRKVQEAKALRAGVKYIQALNEPHYFVLIYRNEDNFGNLPVLTLEKFNTDNFRALSLKTTNMVFGPQHTVTLVDGIPRLNTAVEYAKTFNEKRATLTELRNRKFHSFVITKDNFDILYRTKGLDEYLQFFEENYPKEAQ